MKRKDFYYPSADGQTDIHCIEWTPDNKQVAGVLQIAHGMTEYIGRYEKIAAFFTEHGIAVIGNDHLGHGNSVEDGHYPMYFGKEGSWNYVVQDIRSCRVLAGEHFGYVPICMLGFSLGSFAVREYLIRFPGTVDAAVLAGTGLTNPFLLKIVRLLVVREGRIAGEEHTTPLVQKLAFGNYNQKFAPIKTEFDWLCSDETAAQAYENDPMRGKGCSCGLFRELLDGIIFTGKMENIRQMEKLTPILLISGDADPVGDSGKGVKKLAQAFQKNRCSNVTTKLFPGRHDILREQCGEEVLNYLYQWLERELIAYDSQLSRL